MLYMLSYSVSDTAIPQKGSETARINLLRVKRFDSLSEDFISGTFFFPVPKMYFWIGFGLDPEVLN